MTTTLFDLSSPQDGSSHRIDNARLRDGFTVEAWIHATADTRTEGMQSLASIWTPRERFDAFTAFDAGLTDGLITRGYFGACFDGRYVYFCPELTEQLATHAVVLRFDTHGDFKDPRSYSAYNANPTAGIECHGYYGGAFDGRYIYFIPRQLDRREYHTHLLRLDTRGEFKDPKSWDAYNIGPDQSGQGCAFDGRYLYLCPGYHGNPNGNQLDCGNFIRYDTTRPFKDAASYQSIEVKPFLGEGAGTYDGAAFDGRYVYFVPLSSYPVRYDTHGRFDDPASWQKFDSKQIGMGIGVGAIYDGRWIYYVPYANSMAARFDTMTHDFSDPKNWQIRDVDLMYGNRTCGFDGGFFDGRYVTFVPFIYGSPEEKYTLHGNYLRYDVLQPFGEESSWQVRDTYFTEGLRTVGFNAGAFDGRYFYAAPWRSLAGLTGGQIGVSGRVLRYDSTGDAATFALRFCDVGHNGGLCAATPGPTFLINTTHGARNVATHKPLPAGKYHILGRYDGSALSLYINGSEVATRKVSATLQLNDQPLTIGALAGGTAAFAGRIERITLRTGIV